MKKRMTYDDKIDQMRFYRSWVCIEGLLTLSVSAQKSVKCDKITKLTTEVG